MRISGFIIYLTILSYVLSAQPKTKGIIKAGGALNGVQGAFLAFSGGGGALTSCNYEVASQTDGLKYFTPYAAIGIQSAKTKFCGLYGGIAYGQYAETFSYTGYKVESFDFPQSQTYRYSGNTGKGRLTSHIIRIELSTFFQYKSTRWHIGTNFDVVFPKTVELRVHHELYEARWHGGPDSVVRLSASETTITLDKRYFNYPYDNIRQDPNPGQIVTMSLWTALEQDFRIKNSYWFFGMQGLYSPSLKYYSLSSYVGFYLQQKKMRDGGK